MLRNKIKYGTKVAIVIPTPSAQDLVNDRLMSNREQMELLKRLTQYGIMPHDCTILSVIQNRHTQPDYCSKKELACWVELLRRDLDKLRPNLVIAVGETALQATTDYVAVDKYRGSPLPCKLVDAIVLPLEGYSNFYSDPNWQPLTDFYAQKAARYQHMTKLPWRPVEIEVTSDIDLLTAEFLSEDYLSNPESLLAIDIECSYSEMTCIGFAKEENKAYVIPLVHLDNVHLAKMLKLIDQIQRSPVKKILQNGNFDITYQGYYYDIKVNNFYWDTMLAMHSMFPNMPKGLDTISSIFTDEPFWKDEGKQWKLNYDKVNWPQFFDYNGKDTCNLIAIYKNQRELMELRGTRAIFEQEMKLCYPLITIELMGMKIDLSKQEELKLEAEEYVRKWELFKSTLLGEELDINTKSPDQLKDLLYNKLKFPKRVKKGSLTADIDAMTSLIPLDPVLIKTIIILNNWRKEFSEYKVKLGPDNRIRTTFKPAGTGTGRLASSKSITGTGTNLQNRTKKLRMFFVPDTGKVLIQADYSKAESWVVAALADDEKMLAALYGEDFHSENASNLLGKTVTKADYSDRQLGKRVSHGANYGMTDFLLQKVLLKDGYSFSKLETQQLLDDYFICYPKVKQNFHEWVKSQLKNGRTLENFFGRKCTFYQHWGTDLFNAAFAWIPQGTVGDMTNRGLINVYQNIPEVDLMLQVHDSLVMQTDFKYLTQSLIDRIEECMVLEMTIKNTTFKIPIDVEVGPNWYDLTDWSKIKYNTDSWIAETFVEP